MSVLLPMTLLPPDDERKHLYTYWGRRIVERRKKKKEEAESTSHPLYVYDGVRGRPIILLGEDEEGKRNFLFNLAIKDGSCGRPIVWIDGKNDPATLQRLYYWCAVRYKRPMLTLLPSEEFNHVTHSWNPLRAARLKITAIADTFFDTYAQTQPNRGIRAQRELQFQRDAFGLMLRIVQSTKRGFNCIDVANFLENPDLLKTLKPLVTSEGTEHYEDYEQMMQADEKFTQRLSPLIRFMRQFDHWSINPYAPSIKMDKLWESKSVVYMGLPEHIGYNVGTSIAEAFISQLKAVNSIVDANDRMHRRSILVVIHHAEGLITKEMASWLCQIRLQNLLIACSFDTTQNLEDIDENFSNNLLDNQANILMFRSKDELTNQWFIDRLHKDVTDFEMSENPYERMTTEHLQNLAPHQYILRTPMFYKKSLLVTGPYLPDPPHHPEFQYHRNHYHLDKKPVLTGLWSERGAVEKKEEVNFES